MRSLSRQLVVSSCLLVLGAAACAPPTPDDPGSTESAANAAPECNPLRVRSVPLDGAVEGLEPTGDAPLPALGPDAEGYFHPPPGYTEGGTFASPAEDPRFTVPEREIAPAAPTGRLRVAEWNVERGNELAGAVRLMKKINADVWLLNETDLYGKNSGGVVVAREIARALGYSYFTGIEFYERRDDRRGTSGNAIVSRYPLSDLRSIDIPMFEDQGGHDWSRSSSEPRCGQRNALSATVRVEAADGKPRTVRLVTLHTENKTSAKVRQMQYDHVLSELVVPGEPTVLAGDLNTISPGEGSRFRRELASRVERDGRARAMFDCSRGDDSHTFSAAMFVRLRIDWLLVQSGEGEVLDCPPGSYSVRGHEGTSDHRPVITEMTVK